MHAIAQQSAFGGEKVSLKDAPIIVNYFVDNF
jgi:hypothetical protein